MSSTPIGLDIGSRWIKAAQWDRAGRSWALRAAAWPRRSAGPQLPAEEARRAAAILDRRGFRGDLAAVLATTDRARLAEVDLPAAEGPARRAAARMELARVCRLDPTAFEFTLWDLPRAARGGEGLAAAAVLSHAEADALVAPLEDAGLSVAAIPAPAEALRALLGPPTGIDAFLDLGASALSIAVLVDGACVYERRLPELGTAALTQAVAAAARLPDGPAAELLHAAGVGGAAGPAAQSLAATLRAWGSKIGDEAAVSLEYASHRYPKAPEGRTIALGGGACHPALLAGASQTLGLEVTPAVRPAFADPGPDPFAPPWCVVAPAAMAVYPGGEP